MSEPLDDPGATQMRDAVRFLSAKKAAEDDALIRRMLGEWVSELDPAVAYRDGEIIGLTLDGIPVGAKAPIVVRA